MIRNFLAMMLALFALTAFAAVDANQADRAELETVKGIGPSLSAKILDARKAGSFKNWGDLVDRVGGVGPGNAARFSQAGLTVAGAAFDGKATPSKATKTAKASKEPKAGTEGSTKARKAKATDTAPV